MHPLATVYGAHRAAAHVAIAENRPEVSRRIRPLCGRCGRCRRQIHRAHCDYQHAAEDRRRLAADTGEIMRAVVGELMAAGWSEQDARNAGVRELTSSEGVLKGWSWIPS